MHPESLLSGRLRNFFLSRNYRRCRYQQNKTDIIFSAYQNYTQVSVLNTKWSLLTILYSNVQ